MSKLDELIQEYCPDGVIYRNVSDIAEVSIGEFVHKNRQNPGGRYPVYNGGTSNTGYYDDYNRTANKIIISARGANAGFVNRVFTNYWSGNSCYTVDITDKNLDWNFAFYWFKSNELSLLGKQQKGGIPAVSKKQVERFRIPVPPLPVQREIVRILDNFTLLTAELTAELTARRKQYEFYRDKLLTFDGANAPLLELRSVVKRSCSGSTPTKGNPEYYTNGTIPWIRAQDVRYNEITEADSRLTEKAVADTAAKWIPENCVIVAISGPTAGRCAMNKIKVTTDQHCLNLEIDETKVLEKYIYYCVYNKYDELIQRKQGPQGDLDSDLVLSLKIPVPTLAVQKRLVYVLDHFDAICSDLNLSLPAEMEARQKQYEFYRDALLTYVATGKINLKDRPAEELNGLILLCQYVFGVAYVTLGNIATDIYRGAGIKRDEVTANGIPCVRYGEIYTLYDISFTECVSHTTEDVVANPKYFEHGDIIFTITGESIEEIAKSIAYLGHEKCMAGGDTVVLKHKQEPRYLSYVLSTTAAQAQKSKGRVKSKVVHSSVPVLKEIVIPLPTLDKQKQIADILDNFHQLCNDISSGLPAEIEARKKQYEYYRDKLLTFPQK